MMVNPVDTFVTQLRRFDSAYQDIDTRDSFYSSEHSTCFQEIIESFSTFLVAYGKTHAPEADLEKVENHLAYAQDEISDAFHDACKEEEEENEDERYDPREEHFHIRDYI